jgi:ubiquinone/menaquinone biosynthesis C-methylase UbiE
MKLTLLQRFAIILRKMYLLQPADFIWFLRFYCLNYKSNLRFREQHQEAPVPPPFMLYDILGSCDMGGFYYSGQEHALKIAGLIALERSGLPLKILEWGCGPARVLQHLKSPDGSNWELWGSDYNSKTITWCMQHLPGIHFIHHDLEPPIPLEGECFDVIYCISVFTHLSEASHYHWVAEIIRLLKPGGLFIGTFHGEKYIDQLTYDEQQQFDSGELVIRGKIREGKKNFSAYHSDNFVQNLLVPFDKFEKITTSSNFSQTVWIATK